MKEAAHLLAEGAPVGASAGHVAATLLGIPGVVGVHHVHVWSVSSRLRAASAHLVVRDGVLSAAAGLVEAAQVGLRESHGIEHATLQLEAVACEPGGVLADPRLASAR